MPNAIKVRSSRWSNYVRQRCHSVTGMKRRVLNHISASTIRAGETIAFVGPSGAGKTTICLLAAPLLRCQRGRIPIDGLDIRQIELDSLRRQIGIVQQDVFLFAGTIRENIAYGRLDATEEEIVDAARRARLDEVIAATCRTGWIRSSASAASSSPAGRSSASRSRACS